MTLRAALVFLIVVPAVAGDTLNAPEIMRRAAENLDQAQKARALYVYDQNVFVRLKRANGKTAREESRQYLIVPGEKGAKRKLVKLEGKIFEGKQEIPYSDPRFNNNRKIDLDGSITDSFARDLLWNRNGKIDWFPIRKSNLDRYAFALKGQERYRDYDVYRVSYRSVSKSVMDDDDDNNCWSGEVLIERTQFEPVLLTSSWDCKIPVAVKTFLGTNVHHIGAKITFRRFDQNVWFPVTCGGEMKLRVLFGYARTIAFSASADNFHKADVQTSIDFEGEAEPPSGKQSELDK